jgi:DNA-binding NtrC family response regulator
VSIAADGAAAIEMIAQQSFDLVLSDIKMPLRTGYEVFAAAKEANPKTPVILTTGFGYDPNHSIVRARREGLAAVLFKPFKVDQLLSEIRNALKTTQPAS